MTNNARKVIALDDELYEMLLAHCDSNIRMGLELLPTLKHEDIARRCVETMEQFKRLKKLLEADE